MTRISRIPKVPLGTTDDCPPFQRWVANAITHKPRRGEGKRAATRTGSSVLDGTCSLSIRMPSDESLGYFRASRWDLDSWLVFIRSNKFSAGSSAGALG